MLHLGLLQLPRPHRCVGTKTVWHTHFPGGCSPFALSTQKYNKPNESEISTSPSLNVFSPPSSDPTELFSLPYIKMFLSGPKGYNTMYSKLSMFRQAFWWMINAQGFTLSWMFKEERVKLMCWRWAKAEKDCWSFAVNISHEGDPPINVQWETCLPASNVNFVSSRPYRLSALSGQDANLLAGSSMSNKTMCSLVITRRHSP